MFITNDIRYIGVNDHDIDLFESQYIVPNGMAYNSYVILDGQIAVMDSVEARFGAQWLANLEAELAGRTPDYLVVQHMEPDHSANISTFMERFPAAKIVASNQAFAMMAQFYGTNYADRRIVVKEGDTLNLGRHVLQFVAAPMVHWPEVMMTYDQTDKVFFSADAFGKFGALDVEEEWACEARRYYFGIVGKFGAQVQRLLAKANKLDIQTICPLHGPVLGENLGDYLALYDTWSAYRPETEGVFIAYTSVYGHTEQAALELKAMLEARGVRVAAADLSREDLAEAVEDGFRHSKLVLASTTYNTGVFPAMETYLHHLTERGYQNRTVAFIENGSWAPSAAKAMAKLLEGSKDLTILPTTVTIRSALNDQSRAALEQLCQELA